MQLFVDTARAGSFAEVARRFDLDPSLVSRRIAALERTLGFRLFQRTTRTISLTEAGTDYLARIEPHLVALQEARLASRDLVQRPSGLLRVTASSSFGYEVITPLLPEFCEAAPDVRLELLFTDRRIGLVEEGVDLAIRLGALPDSDMIAKRIMDVHFRVYATRVWAERLDGPPSPDILNETNCLIYSAGQYRGGVSAQSKNGDTLAIQLTGSVSITNALSLKRCAIEGLGPAFLPDWLVARDLEEGKLVDVFPDYTFDTGGTDSAAWFVYPSRLYVPLKVRRFMSFVIDKIGQTPR